MRCTVNYFKIIGYVINIYTYNTIVANYSYTIWSDVINSSYVNISWNTSGSHRLRSYSVCEIFTMTSTPASDASFFMAASRSFPNGSESHSNVSRDTFHSWHKQIITLNIYTKCCFYQNVIYLFYPLVVMRIRRRVQPYLEEPWEDVGRLTADDEQTRVEFTKTRVQILQTLQQKPAKHHRTSHTFMHLHSMNDNVCRSNICTFLIDLSRSNTDRLKVSRSKRLISGQTTVWNTETHLKLVFNCNNNNVLLSSLKYYYFNVLLSNNKAAFML